MSVSGEAMMSSVTVKASTALAEKDNMNIMPMERRDILTRLFLLNFPKFVKNLRGKAIKNLYIIWLIAPG
jgi:hypothetical protein